MSVSTNCTVKVYFLEYVNLSQSKFGQMFIEILCTCVIVFLCICVLVILCYCVFFFPFLVFLCCIVLLLYSCIVVLL